MAGYHVENFGCRASQADGEGIAAGLRTQGLWQARDVHSADVLVVNTCSVTAEADKDARAFVRRTRRLNPQCRIVVTGCYAQRAPAEIAALAGVDRVIGNSHKGLVAAAAAALVSRDAPPAGSAGFIPVERLLSRGKVLVDDSFAHSEIAASGLFPEASARHTRPNLKVQDGCGNRCSFCVIPETRGGSRSVPMARVLEQVNQFVVSGGQELVLSGINLGRWGRDLSDGSGRSLEDLVEAILVQTALPRLRISSVEPMDWSDRLLELFRSYGVAPDVRLARHAHLPLQSGSDAILRAMYRRYRPWHYAEKLAKIREAIPEAAIGADVMVGFPGESDSLFEESFRFIEQQPFTYLHLFPFSARPGTTAWKLHQQKPVHGQAVQERMKRLRVLADNKNHAFRSAFVGRALSVVTLQGSDEENRGTRALSDNFLTVELQPYQPANHMVQVNISKVTGKHLEARLNQL